MIDHSEERKRTNAIASYLLSIEYYKKGKYSDAEDLINFAISTEWFSNDAKALYYRGEILSALHRYDEAAKDIKEAIESLRDHPRCNFLLGWILMQKGENKFAEHYFLRAIHLAPDTPRYVREFAKFLSSQQRESEAVYYFEKAAELTPADGEAQLQLAFSYERLGHASKALTAIRQASSLRPERLVELRLHAKLASQCGELTEAKSVYRRILAVNPSASFAWIGLSTTLETLGHLSQAYKAASTAINLMPSDSFAQHLTTGIFPKKAESGLPEKRIDIVHTPNTGLQMIQNENKLTSPNLEIKHALELGNRKTPYNDGFYSAQVQGSVNSAKVVLPFVFKIIGTPEAMIDVGCGLGTWLHVAKSLGCRNVLGVDGPWVRNDSLLINEDEFISAELNSPNLLKFFENHCIPPVDLVSSLEVAEHLEKRDAAGFIETLCSLSDTVLFGAAIPDQGGTNHVNEAWPDYWSELFKKNGFSCFDVVRPSLWNERNAEWWYLQNTFIYARLGSPSHERLISNGPPVETPLPLVHPRFLRDIMWNIKNKKMT